MFDDDDPLFKGLVVFGLAQNHQRQAEMAEYQRQQLNLLRQHQGLSPIEAPDNGPGWLMMAIVYLYTVPFILLFGFFGAVALWNWNPVVAVVVGGLIAYRIFKRPVNWIVNEVLYHWDGIADWWTRRKRRQKALEARRGH